jgi:uncharacterized protein YcfJ
MPIAVIALIIGLIIGYRLGWEGAHRTVATECEKLGSFYVGERVFHCTKIQGAPGDE